MELTPKPYPTETSTEYLLYLDKQLATLKLWLEELNKQLEQLEDTILNEYLKRGECYLCYAYSIISQYENSSHI